MTGRIVTAQFMPLRKDFDNYVQEQAKKEGTKTPVTNYAPIIKLSDGDVYVADSYGKKEPMGPLLAITLEMQFIKPGKEGSSLMVLFAMWKVSLKSKVLMAGSGDRIHQRSSR